MCQACVCLCIVLLAHTQLPNHPHPFQMRGRFLVPLEPGSPGGPGGTAVGRGGGGRSGSKGGGGGGEGGGGASKGGGAAESNSKNVFVGWDAWAALETLAEVAAGEWRGRRGCGRVEVGGTSIGKGGGREAAEAGGPHRPGVPFKPPNRPTARLPNRVCRPGVPAC